MKLNKLWVLFGLLFTTELLAQQRVAFVTSVGGNGDLSSWADAGLNTGLAAGDAICQARAAAGGLANAENFVALLSDSTDDAYCRITGHSGKKADLCGQASLPTDAGPWVNVLGENLSESLPLMLAPDYLIYRTLKYDEFGAAINLGVRYFTGSFAGADAPAGENSCDDWTSTNSTAVKLGSSAASGSGIIFDSTNSCSSNQRLACFETVAGDPLLPEIPLGSLAFVTSETGNGDLSSWPSAGGEVGIDAADQICQTAAFNAGLEEPDAFIAWLSDDTTDAIDRFEYNGPWFRQDGVLVANDLIELTSLNLQAPNNLTEDMFYLGSNFAWTGTDRFGLASINNCENWQTSNNALGSLGITHHTFRFSEGGMSACGFETNRHLYCFHNVALDLIYEDDFESIKALD